MKVSVLFFLLCGFVIAQPLRPTDRILDPSVTMPIAIHPESTTLLVFPEAVTLIVGAGLSDGTTPGSVHYQHAKNPKHIVLRQLAPDSTVLMQIAMGEDTYAFKLTGGERPDNIIRFHKNSALGTAVEVTEEEVRQDKLEVPEERQKQLIRLMKGERALRPKLPDAYEKYVAKEVSFTAEQDGLKTTVRRLARFGGEDAVILKGEIYNQTTNPVDLSKRGAMVRVGETQIAFPASHFAPSQEVIRPNHQVDYSAVLIGDGRGKRLHLDLRKNRFLLNLNSSKP